MKRPSPLWLIPVAAALLLLVPAAASAQPTNAPVTLSAHGAGGGVHDDERRCRQRRDRLSDRLRGRSSPPSVCHARSRGPARASPHANSVVLTANHQWLLVVNAGSNSISVFHVNSGTSGPLLTFVDQTRSRGQVPVSIAVHGSLVYALNAGSSSRGATSPASSSRAAGTSRSWPARTSPSARERPPPRQISFNPSGTVLVVTEKNTNVIDTYAVGAGGLAQPPTVTTSSGVTPYGFAWGKGGTLIVSDAASDALSSCTRSRRTVPSRSWTRRSATTAPRPAGSRSPTAGPGPTPPTRTAARSRPTRSGPGGTTLVSAVAATTGAADTDMGVGGSHGQYLFVYDAGAGEIEQFGIGSTGGLPSFLGGLRAAGDGGRGSRRSSVPPTRRRGGTAHKERATRPGRTMSPVFRSLDAGPPLRYPRGSEPPADLDELVRSPANAHQLAASLALDYRTVRHHLRILERNGAIARPVGDGTPAPTSSRRRRRQRTSRRCRGSGLGPVPW